MEEITMTKKLDEGRWYSLKDAADWLGIGAPEIRRMMVDRFIAYDVVGRVFRVRGAEIKRVLVASVAKKNK